MFARERTLNIVIRREPKVNDDTAEWRVLVPSEALLAERIFQLRRCDHAGLDQPEPDPVITTHLFTDHAQQADKIGRAERLDDEGGGPDGARERAVLRIVVGCQ